MQRGRPSGTATSAFVQGSVSGANRTVLEFGVGDGLRLDAVPYLYEREGTNRGVARRGPGTRP